MARKETEVKVYKVEYYCDKCGFIMESAGIVYLSDPEQYPYKCSNKKCDVKETYMQHYPAFEYREVDG